MRIMTEILMSKYLIVRKVTYHFFKSKFFACSCSEEVSCIVIQYVIIDPHFSLNHNIQILILDHQFHRHHHHHRVDHLILVLIRIMSLRHHLAIHFHKFQMLTTDQRHLLLMEAQMILVLMI